MLGEAFCANLPGNASAVVSRPGMYDPVKVRTVAAEMLRAQPGLDYAFVANEQTAFAARKAFDAAGAKGVRTVTVNGTDEALAAPKDGRFTATVSNSAADTGEPAVETSSPCSARRRQTRPTRRGRLVTEDNTDTAPLYCPPED
ncbi:hypothetical protein ABZ137_23610 [Streptomyces bobili]|uniref:hypothetical protein n=1 Tax=Streptomyces bobili TaxID=67280 RepID=UPI00339E3597